MSSLEDRTDLLPAEKRALLAEVLRRKATGNRQVPVSFAQQRLWFLDQLEPGNASYNISRAVRVKGSLNLEALRDALNAIVARHESLRTNFTSIDDEPMQIIAPAREIEIQLLDLGGLPESDRDSEARRLAAEESSRAFDIAQDQLLRVVLFRLDDQDQVLLLVLHHIVSDGWSMGVLFRELETLYEAFANSLPSPLSNLPIQYGDFARWQRDRLRGEVLAEQVDFWKQQLAGAPAMLELATDKPRPAVQTFGGAYHTSMVGKELTDSLNELCRREGVTLFMALVAAFQTMLHRYTNQRDIVVGTPIANRTREETEDLIGLFVNTLVVRTDLSGNPSFRELLGRVREVALDAFAHQDLPFEKLVEEIHPERSLGHMPLFQVLFALQNVPKSAWKLGSLDLTDSAFEKSTSKLDLSLYVGERADGLSFSFEYSTDLFNATTIESMAANFQTLLEGIVANPEQRLSELPVLAKQEWAQLLVEWNDTEAEYRAGKCIHELFEEQVENRGDEIALISEKAKLTFRELNSRANQLAHFLKGRGVGPEVLVGVCIERSVEMVVGLLAILKAGGAYVPLDPSHPTERISFMLHDSGARLLLTQQHLGETLASWDGETIYVDSKWPEIALAPVENPANTAGVANAAYVLYTSGSTGRPKGVVSAHRASINRFEWMWRVYPFAGGEVCCQKTSLSFGDAIWEIFGPLLQGVPLVLIPDEVVKDPGVFIAALSANRVTRLVLVPSLLRVILETSEDLAQQLKSLRYCVCSGETLTAELARSFRERVPHAILLNLYGSSEVAADVLYYEVSNKEGLHNIPIGKPIANTNVFILDSNFEPVPLGVLGQIYVGGDGLARGYWNSAQLTAEKFVPHPFSGQPGARLFRTGDIGRYLPDGNIEYHGRRDHQVKVRGYRIELGEIETSLKGCPSVQDAVVMLRQSTSGNKYLVGYVVYGASPSKVHDAAMSSELRNLLKKSLPDYMLPAHFVFLQQLPLTPSGKIDRRTLPQPDGTRPELEEAHVAPRDDLERRLANIWERMLAVKSVGIRDNFFNLGGHSLLAVRVVSEIAKETGQRLPLVSFFQGPNIEYLASLLRQDVRSISWPTLVEIQAGGPNAPLFCVSIPNVNALGYRSLARYLGTDQPVFGLQGQYPEDLYGEHSQAAVEKIVTDYLEVLRSVRPTGPYQFVGLCRGAHIAYEIARRLEREGHEIALLGIIDTWVMENTYNKTWLLTYHAKRLTSLTLRGIRKQLELFKNERGRLANNGDETSATAVADVAERKRKTIRLYFPGRDFVPSSYRGRIAVFRTERQPRNRIHDSQLGWGKLAKGGVDLHFIPGDHDSVLKEPHVQGLAAALKKCLRQSD